ncbi:TPA: ead/Ea22-like family protein [Klebsiella pneumoniae]|nr:ead/Ea22-like family protein [Klebsiella pneumoniae]HBU3058641.1 ead/Ea22-like family protein [Klebsiella pneumoniae]
MTTDITELAQDLKAAAENATPGHWEYNPGNTSIEYNVDSMDEDQGSIVYVDSGDFTQAQTDRNGEFIALANPANVLALVEALEKAQQHIARQEQILLNQDESLSIRRDELEAAQQERDNWRTSFDNERFRADKLKAHIDEMTEERTASINELSRIIQKEVKTKREAEKRIAELEAQNEYVRKRYQELDLLIGKNILVMQAAIIEWRATGDAKNGLAWIYNTLFGPGELPDEAEKDAQAYFDRKYAPLDEELMVLHKWFWEKSEAERAAAGIKVEAE